MTDQATPDVSNKILGRIKRMMALANDAAASEGERDNALRMSYKLLAAHNLSMVDVEAHGAVQPEKREQHRASFVVYPWARNMAHNIAELFFCKYYFQRAGSGKQATHTFLGKVSNATTCSIVADYVVRSVLKEAARRYRSAISPEARDFAVGVARRIGERVRELRREESAATPGTALVLASLYDSEKKANDSWLAQLGVTLTVKASSTKAVTNAAAYHAGKKFGDSVSLSAQVGHTANTTKRLE
ncbi:Domain of unknown function DUF2786 [uncultured Caudovirales phage]|uniref:Uncharacterized protein n=1 Tax=uncultured Caudovirales phage TaxID=2100421 RepID=A0A6J5REN1_9CAUD|nr:Domain of unknown function DUF2786 [uncultured Caudovirales phage]